MKTFENPVVEVVRFESRDIITASYTCRCVDCTVCPEGKDNCPCVDFNN